MTKKSKTILSKGDWFEIFADLEPDDQDWKHVWIDFEDSFWKTNSDGELRMLFLKDHLKHIIDGFKDTELGIKFLDDIGLRLKDGD